MSSIRLSFAGDLFLSGDYATLPDDQKHRLFDGLAGALNGSDLSFANFEGVVIPQEPDDLTPDKIRLPVHPAYVDALRRAGFNVLSLSNNHVFDYGLPSFQRSRDTLWQAGFCVFGAGESDDEAGRTVIKRVNGTAIGFLGFTCASTHPAHVPGVGHGVVLRQVPDVLQRIVHAKQSCDLLVVSVHWGDEHVAWPSPEQIAESRRWIDAGADVVVGHHAHVFQGCERYRHGVIAYGLGGVTIASLRQRVVWQGVAQDYDFQPRPRHRRSVVMSLCFEDGCLSELLLDTVRIGMDGRPACAGRAPRRWGLLASKVWHLPGYAFIYRVIVAFQFSVLPRLRWAFSAKPVRKLLRRWLRPR